MVEKNNVAAAPEFLHDISLELEEITDTMLVCSTNARFTIPNAMILHLKEIYSEAL